MIADAAERLFARDPSDAGWRAAGFGTLLAEGGSFADAHALMLEAGRAAAAPGLAAALADGDALREQLFAASETAGHLAAALALALDHTTTRRQFGKPLAAQQSVQHGLAVLAVEADAARVGAEGAARALDAGLDGTLEIPAAALRARQAARVGIAIAHQLHGAIGFTAEHRLAAHSRRLKALAVRRPSEGDLARMLGAALPPDPWDWIARRLDRELLAAPR